MRRINLRTFIAMIIWSGWAKSRIVIIRVSSEIDKQLNLALIIMVILFLSYYLDDHIDTDSSLSSSCDTLAPPKHGTILCGSKKSVMDSEVQRLPEGSICRVQCNRQFEVPFHIEKYSIFSCSNGHWNSTMMEFCRRSRR